MTTHQTDATESSTEETTDEHAEGNRITEEIDEERNTEDGIDISALREEIAATEEAEPERDGTETGIEENGDATDDVDPIVELGISDVDLPASDSGRNAESEPESKQELELESEPESKQELELESETTPKAEPASDPEPEPKPDFDLESDIRTEPEAALETEPPRSDATENATEGGIDTSEPSADESVLAALIEELETGSLTEEQQATLRSGLGVEPPNSVDVRLRHVQEQLDDIVAYRNALEAFIDENGDATEIIDDIHEQFETVDARIETLETHLSDLEGDIETIEDRQRTALDEIDDRIEALETSFDVATQSAEEERTALRERIEECELWREKLNDAFAGRGIEEDESAVESTRDTQSDAAE